MEIVAANRAGVGLQTAAVRVPAAPPPAPLLPAVVYHAGTRRYELRWPAKENLTYTAYVCTDGLSFHSPCSTNLYWKNLGSVSAVNLTLEELNVTDSVTPDEVRFALSAETFAEDSSGMAWDSCIHPQQYNTQHSAPEIITNYHCMPFGARYHRQHDEQRESALEGGLRGSRGVIEEVQAIWCEGRDSCVEAGNGIPRKIESDVFSGVVVLEGLREGSAYTANLRLRYRDGLSGWSSPLPFATKSSALPTWLIVTIVIVAIAVTVVVLSAGVYSRRKIQVIARDARREIVLPDGLGDSSAFCGSGGQDNISDIRSRNSFTTTMLNNHDSIYDNVQFREPLADQILRLEKEYLQGPFSGGRGLAQSKADKEDPPQAGDVRPAFPTDVTGDKTRNGDEGYGIVSKPDSSTIGLSDPAIAPWEAKPSPGYTAILSSFSELHSDTSAIPSALTNAVGTPYSRVYRRPEEFVNEKAHEKSPAGHVASPSADYGTQTSSNLAENGGRKGKRISSTGYMAFPEDFGNEGISSAAQPSPGYVAILPQYSTFNNDKLPAPSISTNEIRAPYSSVYRSPEEFKNIREHEKSFPGHAVFPPTDSGMQSSDGIRGEVDKDTEESFSTGFGMQPPREVIKSEDRNKHDTYSEGYVLLPSNLFGTQTSSNLRGDMGQKIQGISSAAQASPPAGFGTQASPKEIHQKETGAVPKAPKGPVASKTESKAETRGYVMIDFPISAKDTRGDTYQSGANSESSSSNKEKCEEASGIHHYVSRVDGRSKISSDQKNKTSGEVQSAMPSAGYVTVDFPFVRFSNRRNSLNQLPNSNEHMEETEMTETKKGLSPPVPCGASEASPILESELNALCNKPPPDIPMNVPVMTVHRVLTEVTAPENSSRSSLDVNVGSAATSGYVRTDHIYSGKNEEY
ncbi:hypothetical protein C7M84_014464 [Penaeus vannamei]|uniref:Uncharacterized protein n=1 Tax=Penaeus vannamei TaxID=6689 RepID=A0A423STF2_PENVA|nr:hypothetical protein C7M84_014464 [Penaeus vannamei]